jgi:hypothetical protein
MYDFLKDHALKNVWCSPEQDRQLILEPKRITPPGGVSRYLTIAQRRTNMPDNRTNWHIYQIGQLHPMIIGLLPKMDVWQNFSAAMNERKMICDIYVNSGLQLPRYDTFYMFNSDRNLIMAVRKNPFLAYDFDEDNIYLRLYTNAYFASLRSDAIVDRVFTAGTTPRQMSNLLEFQMLYDTYKTKPGLTYAFVNGFKVSDIDLLSAKVGDFCEFVYDSSIKKVFDFKISDLNVFNSTMDLKRKYLLHYAGADDGTIDYRDDIDIFILDPMVNGKHKGLYYHKNQDDSMRMVTHRDYSVPTPYVLGYFDELRDEALRINASNTIVFENLYVRLHVRKAGYDRDLLEESNRINDLYKLSEVEIVRAMVGLDAVVDNWKAEVLEASAYTELMGKDCCDITNELVQEAYGYNLISKIVGNTPARPYNFSQRRVIDVPYGLQTGMTAYEYDAQGRLLEYHQQFVGSLYVTRNPLTEIVELVGGLGSQIVSDRTGVDSIPVDPTQAFKVYFNPSAQPAITTGWTDVTALNDYVVVDGYFKRSDNQTNGQFMIRDEKRFLAYNFELSMGGGELRFNLSQTGQINGDIVSTRMYVPMGELDIFLNNKPLIRNLDYIVKFPEVCIVNKEYLDDPLNKLQKIHVRFTSFCDEQLNLSPVSDVGFIKQGTLSRNNKYDLRDDRVIRIVVDGMLKTKQDLLFSETTNQVSILNVANGKPYSVRDVVVPLKYLSTQPSFILKKKSVLIDQAVSSYLTIKLPQPVISAPSAIVARYTLYSPFLCAIIYDLINGVITTDDIRNVINSDAVRAICAPYENLLFFDPSQQVNPVDGNFVIVHPHNLNTVIEVDLFSYKFLEKVTKIYTGDYVSLSPFLSLKPV